jgi:hypothetical protein
MPLVLLVLVSCSPKEGRVELQASQVLGTVLARETVHAAGSKKQVVLIVPQWAANSTVGESFTAALKKQGVSVESTIIAEVGDPMGRQALGLKSTDFFKVLQKGAGAGAIVSLAGAPLLNGQNATQVNPNHPPMLVVATSSLGNVLGVPADRAYLSGLLNAKVVQLAIVGGESQTNANPAGKTDPTEQLFFQNYTILRSGD